MSLDKQVRKAKASVMPTDYFKKKDPTWKDKFIGGLAGLLNVDISANIEKTSTVIPMYMYDSATKARKPQYDYYNLILKSLFNWPIRVVINGIVRECTRNWGHIEPRFTLKCDKCGEEYQEEVDSCETIIEKGGEETTCDGDLSPPVHKQKRWLKDLTKKTSRNRKFYEFVRASIWYELAVDSMFWSIVYEEIGGQWGHAKKFRGKEVFVEHPGFIFPVADEFGMLGDSNYFCPECYNLPDYKGDDLHWDMRDRMTGDPKKDVFKCPLRCGHIMVRTAYVQEIGGKIRARFGANEIVHASRNRLPPSLFGNPDTISVLEIIDFMEAIDKKKRESAIEAKSAGLLAFPGLSQETVGSILRSIKDERAKLTQRDPQTGEPESAKRSSLILVGLDDTDKAPVRIPFEDPEEMSQNIEFYKMYLRAVGDIFGVSTVIFQAASEKRGGGSEIRLQIEVANRTAEEHQRVFMEAFNEDLLPLFGVTDWIWIFDKIEPKDKLRDAQIWVQKSAAAINFLKAGFDVKIDDKGELVVTGEGKLVEDTGRTGLPNEQEDVTPGGVGAETAPEQEDPSD